jgi:hypothetical protein
MLLIPNVLILILRLGLKRGLLLLTVAFALVIGLTTLSGNLFNIVTLYLNPQALLNSQAHAWSLREAEGDHPLKLLVGKLLLPRSLASLILLSPVRAVIWFFLPYPLIVPDWGKLFNLPQLLVADPLTYFKFGADLPALLSTWLLIGLSPFLAAAGLARRTWQNPAFQLVVINLLTILLIISNLQFIMGRRYRTLLEPLILAVALWGSVHGQPKKFMPWFYGLLIAGVLLVEFISLGG